MEQQKERMVKEQIRQVLGRTGESVDRDSIVDAVQSTHPDIRISESDVDHVLRKLVAEGEVQKTFAVSIPP